MPMSATPTTATRLKQASYPSQPLRLKQVSYPSQLLAFCRGRPRELFLGAVIGRSLCSRVGCWHEPNGIHAGTAAEHVNDHIRVVLAAVVAVARRINDYDVWSTFIDDHTQGITVRNTC